MRIKETLRLFREGYGGYRGKLGILVILGLLGGFLEGIGITALVPLFAQLLGSGAGSTDIVSRAIAQFLGLFGMGAGIKILLLFIVFAFIFKAAVLFLVTRQFLGVRQ